MPRVDFAMPGAGAPSPSEQLDHEQRQQHMFEVMLKLKTEEAAYRGQFLADVAERIARAGGWAIHFDASTEPSPVISEELCVSEFAVPVRVVDGALPPSWCDRFVDVHTAAGFTPQHILDATVGSPETLATRKLIEEARSARASSTNSQNFDAEPRSALELEAGRDAAYQGGKNTSEVVEVVSNEFAEALWQRVEAFVPATILSTGDFYSDKGATWRAVGVIPTFRFMRYSPGQAFKPHKDPSRLAGSDPRSGVPGRFRSLVTLVLYLNDAEEFGGGGLHFVHFVPNPEQTGKAMISEPTATVMPKRSRCVIFEHRLQHESEAIAAGVKHMVQCDVLYQLVWECP